MRYNLGIEVSGCAFDLLNLKRLDLLEELLTGYGFVLTEQNQNAHSSVTEKTDMVGLLNGDSGKGLDGCPKGV